MRRERETVCPRRSRVYFQNALCVLSKRSRVCRQNARVTKDTGVLTAHTGHGSVLNVHTAPPSVQEQRRETTRRNETRNTHSTAVRQEAATSISLTAGQQAKECSPLDRPRCRFCPPTSHLTPAGLPFKSWTSLTLGLTGGDDDFDLGDTLALAASHQALAS